MGFDYANTGGGIMQEYLSQFSYRGKFGECCGPCCDNCKYLDHKTFACDKQIEPWDYVNQAFDSLSDVKCPDWESVYN